MMTSVFSSAQQVIVIPLRPLHPDGFDQGLLLMEGDLVLCLVLCSLPLSKLISEFISQDTTMRGFPLESHSAFLADLTNLPFSLSNLSPDRASRTDRASVKNTTCRQSLCETQTTSAALDSASTSAL